MVRTCYDPEKGGPGIDVSLYPNFNKHPHYSIVEIIGKESKIQYLQVATLNNSSCRLRPSKFYVHKHHHNF
jgi:hypothetical protein